MSLSTLPKQLQYYPLETLPHYMQVGVCMHALSRAGAALRPIEFEVYANLRQEHLRRHRRDENHTYYHETKALHGKTFEQRRQDWFDRVHTCAAWLRGNMNTDGKATIQDADGHQTRTKDTERIAAWLREQTGDAGIMREHVRDARQLVRGGK